MLSEFYTTCKCTFNCPVIIWGCLQFRYHKLGGFKWQELILTINAGWRCRKSHDLTEGSGQEPFLASLLLWVVAKNPPGSLVSHQLVPSLSRGNLFAFVQPLLFFEEHQSYQI